GPTTHVAVVEGDEELGALTVEMPPGRAVRARDEALLRDLADQALVAFRNASLSAELERRVAELDAQAGALEDSRRRLITAGDAERQRLERAVSRDVAPFLAALPARLESFGRPDSEPVTSGDVGAMRTEVEK